MRAGKESTRHPGMGVYARCIGPDSPMPGERLHIVIYDHADQVVRRFEQIRGACLVEGYATFFANDPRARQAVFLWPLVDIDASGDRAASGLPQDPRPGAVQNNLSRLGSQMGYS